MTPDDFPVLHPITSKVTLPKTREPDGYVSIFIEVEGVRKEIEANVYGTYFEGSPRTRNDPGVTGGWVVDEIKDDEGNFLTPLLSDDQLYRIAREVWP